MNYKKLTVFYLSGTGNALTATEVIREEALSSNISTEVQSIDRLRKPDLTAIEKSDIIGLCYPTHGFSLPWHMFRFILSFPRTITRKDVFLLNTRAGSKLFALFLPGISGIAQWLPLFILWLKGYKIRGLLPLDMPSNWISIHPGYTTKAINSITSRCKKITKIFASRLLSGKPSYRPMAFIMIPLDVFLIPISIGYMLVGRFFMAKTFIATYKCTNCDICIKNCPVGAIEKKFNRPYWTIHCESCMRCMNICPERAIDTAHGYVTLLVFAFLYIPFFSLSSQFIMSFLETGIDFIDGLFDMTIFTILSIPFLIISYYLVIFLQKFKVTSIIFRFTSLTTYWKHYMAPDIKITNFKRDRKS